ncbi:SlyX family protein [Orrella sp. JC864]|uniref:SlyX family protein n=1 Tax=Orrella sp. JC864 TaxID=3120298 RepID=UPI0012BD6FC5
MDDIDELRKRLTELEIKACLADDMLDQLNETVFRQQRQIEVLVREIAALREQAGPDGAATARSLREELPPHY